MKIATWLKDHLFQIIIGVLLVALAAVLSLAVFDTVRLEKCDDLCDPVTAERCHHESWSEAAIQQACGGPVAGRGSK